MSMTTLELVRREDFVSADVDVLSLLSYTDGLNLAMQGWVPAIAAAAGAEAEFALTPEAMTLLVQASTDDALATVMRDLSEKRQQAEYYASGVDRYGIWLRAKLANETYTRQALIKSLAYNWGQSLIRPNRINLQNFTLGVDRYTWEDTSHTEFTGAAVPAIGGTFAFTSNAGDLPARLACVKMEDTGTAPIWRYWLGFRGTRHSSTPANFEPVWNLRKAYAYGADTTGGTSNSDSTAEDTYKVLCTFATTTTMANRVYCRVRDAAAGYPEDQRGRFQLLLRARLTAAGSVVRVRRFTGSSARSLSIGQRIQITGTTWQYLDMGVINIPGTRLLYNVNTPSEFHVGVQAELVSGTADLELDCFILIPVDEGFVHMARVDNYAYSPPDMRAMQYADGRTAAIVMGTTFVSEMVPHVITGGLPVGSGVGVVAAERYMDSAKTDTEAVSVKVYQRWESLRGANT